MYIHMNKLLLQFISAPDSDGGGKWELDLLCSCKFIVVHYFGVLFAVKVAKGKDLTFKIICMKLLWFCDL